MDWQGVSWIGAAIVAALTIFNFVHNFGRENEKTWNTKFDALYAALSLHEDRTAERFAKIGEIIAAIQVKVDTMWDFTLRRAQSEAIINGLANKNSPLHFTNESARIIQPLLADLQIFYASIGQDIPDSMLALEIERNFGDRLLNEVCIPNGLHMGACLLIAIEAAKGLLTCPPLPN